MDSYLDLLDSFNVIDSNNLITIENVSLNKTKKEFNISIIMDKSLNLPQYKAFFKANEDIFNKISCGFNLDIVYKNIVLNDDEIKEYYYEIVNNLLSENPFYSLFKDFQIVINDECLTILVNKISDLYLDCAKNIKKEFLKYNLPFEVLLKTDESLEQKVQEHINDIKEEQRLEQIEKQNMAEENARKAKIEISKSSYISQKLEITPLDKIPSTQDEIFEYENTKGEVVFRIQGEVFFNELKDNTKGKSQLLTLKVFDGSDSIVIKKWISSEADKDTVSEFKPGVIVEALGKVIYDTYMKAVVFNASKIKYVKEAVKVVRIDSSLEKRVELNVHTKMSNLDGICDPKEYIKAAIGFGHNAMAFTDRNGVYSIPDIVHAVSDLKVEDSFKTIYGVELDYIDDTKLHITYAPCDILLNDAVYVVFDLESTGLSQKYDEIIEISAYKVTKGNIIDTYETFVNPKRPIPPGITNLTSITDEDVKDAPYLKEALDGFLEFSKGTILVAHNADFDIGMIHKSIKEVGYEDIPLCGIDTLNLCRAMYGNELSKFNLKAISKFFKVKQEHHHRASDDTRVLAECFFYMLQDMKKRGINNYNEINSLMNDSDMYLHVIPKRINLLVQNQVGYKNMFKLLSDALTEHLAGDARLLKSVLDSMKEGILTTSSGSFGNVFECALNRSEEELEEAIKDVDIVEVQPPTGYLHLIDFLNDGHDGEKIIKETITRIVNKAYSLGKIVVATSDAYYINPEEKKYRDILIASNQVGGGFHELKHYACAPDAHLRTTNEMIQEFDFLDPEIAYEIVVTNTNKVANMIEKIRPFHKEMFVPADDEFKDHPDPKYRFPSMIEAMKEVVASNMLEKYGENPHPFVAARVDRELKAIISSGYYSTYFMAYLMVKDSLDNGYLVGSRGSVGSSFVATMMNITEVNPLPPHYLCPKCKFMAIKFSPDDESKINSEEERELQSVLRKVGSGYDLNDMKCPCCGEIMDKDGQDIPFETFLGFNGDKVPDIDLNFSGEYQPKAHLFVRHLMGYDNSFRGGTVGTIADKNGFGYVKAYSEAKNKQMRSCEIERIAQKLVGIKRSTGQHPGGIVVVPKRIDIYDVTPIQYPANDKTNAWRTTHFDYHAFENNLLKLDILGHDDPTLIKYFMDIVHEHQEEFPFSDPRKIPVYDPKIYALFGSTSSIGVDPKDIDSPVASYAVPEFGTNFVRQMLIDTKPESFAGLVKISGLSHGTDVWLNNAKELVNGTTEFGKISFNDIIGCRDDIMVDLLFFGLEPIKAFKIMEFVRKGNVSKKPEDWEKYKQDLKEKNVPEWYIWSCEKIKYMFPKAHACAYVLMALRIAWFKVYKPAMFYSAYFSKRAAAYDINAFLGTPDYIKERIRELNLIKNKTAKDEDLITVLGVILEAKARGIKFLPVDINKSDSLIFTVCGSLTDGALRIPFVAVDGLGQSVALDIVEKRNEKEFTSRKDVLKRTRLNETLFNKFIEMGAFGDLKEEDDELDVGLFAL